MVIGIVKEIKEDEFRVGATPFNVAVLINDGHKVLIECGAGTGSGFSDNDYKISGALMLENAAEVYAQAQLIVKVKEPQPSEYNLLNNNHILFTFLHLAPMKELTSLLVQKGVTAIGYETVETSGIRPLLKPMSEIAGKMASIVGSYHLSSYNGGKGVLISGATGVIPAKVLVIGAGNAGFNAARTAIGLGADVTVINRTAHKLESLQRTLPSVKTALYSPQQLRELLKEADLVISTVLVPGAKTPKLIDRKILHEMKPGSVIVDVAIDQGGTLETSRPTTHHNPTFSEEGILHYCVANMPGAYPKTSTTALTNATLPYIRRIAADGFTAAVSHDASLACGVNIYRHCVTSKAVAEATGFEYTPLKTLLN